MSMSDREIAGYASALGVNLRGCKTLDEKAARIEEARERTAVVEVMGERFTVPIKVMHDKRIVDAIDGAGFKSNDELNDVVLRMLGEVQAKRLTDLVTEDDGYIDVDAWAVALNSIIFSPKLKNFSGSRSSKRGASAS